MIFTKRTIENITPTVKCPVEFTKGYNFSCFNTTLYDGFPGDSGTGWHTPTLSKINTQLNPNVLSAIRSFGVENLRVPCEPEWFWRNYPNEVGDIDTDMVDLLNYQADLLHAAGFKNLMLGMFHLPNGNNGAYNWASGIINSPTFRSYYLDYVTKMVAATKDHYDSFYFMNEVGTQFGASLSQMALWQAWCTEAVDAVRSEAPDAWVVVPAPSYADPSELPKMTPIAREKIIYDIHFYEPFVFSHSSAGFLGSPFEDFVYLNDLQYPANTSQCNTYYNDYLIYDVNGSPPPWTVSRALGASVKDRILGYKNHNNVYHSTEEWVRAILLNAYNWGKIHNKPVMAGEWGTFATSMSQKSNCRVATTANISSTYSSIIYGENTPWLNAKLTGLANGAIGAIDAITLVAGDRVLVKNQSNDIENGIYTVTAVGNASYPFVLTRARDADSELRIGTYVQITSGTANNGKYFRVTSDVSEVGSDSIVFAQFTPSLSDNSPDDITSLRLWYRHVSRALSEMGMGSFVWPTINSGYWNRPYGQFLDLFGTNNEVQKAINYIEDDTGYDYGTSESFLPSVAGVGKIANFLKAFKL